MNKHTLAWLGLLCLLCAGAGVAEPPRLAPQESLYELHMGPLTLGEARFTLEPAQTPDCYRYQYVANPQGLAKMFIGQLREISDFCVTEAGLRSEHFEFHRADQSNKDYALDFDWSTGVVRGGDPKEQKVPPDALDRLAIQQAVRLWVKAHVAEQTAPEEVDYTMADRTRVVTYRFALRNREKIKVPAGSFESVIVERTDDPKKTLRFWLAPERDYVPVKVIQDQEGQPELRMYLK